jgi:hypothetical protein
MFDKKEKIAAILEGITRILDRKEILIDIKIAIREREEKKKDEKI